MPVGRQLPHTAFEQARFTKEVGIVKPPYRSGTLSSGREYSGRKLSMMQRGRSHQLPASQTNNYYDEPISGSYEITFASLCFESYGHIRRPILGDYRDRYHFHRWQHSRPGVRP